MACNIPTVTYFFSHFLRDPRKKSRVVILNSMACGKINNKYIFLINTLMVKGFYVSYKCTRRPSGRRRRGLQWLCFCTASGQYPLLFTFTSLHPVISGHSRGSVPILFPSPPQLIYSCFQTF